MRKKLGCLEKAPIQRLEQRATKNSFAFISCFFALIVTYFGINFCVDMWNFLEENSDGTNFIANSDQIVWYIKGTVGLISVVFIMNRQ